MDYFLIFTEGFHDQAFIQKVLEVSFGFQKFRGDSKQLDIFWKPLTPAYPPSTGNLYSRVSFPGISSSSTISVAIYTPEGVDKIDNFKKVFKLCPQITNHLKGYGIVVDAETRSPEERFIHLKRELGNYFPNLPEKPGEVSSSTPYQGIFVLPDNINEGTLEDILLPCADVVYPDLKKGSQEYIAGVTTERKKENWKGVNDEKKAWVACISNILKPGATNTASIADKEWVSEKTISIPEIVLLRQFLSKLLGVKS